MWKRFVGKIWRSFIAAVRAAGDAALSIFGIRTAEETPYRVLQSDAPIELREYSPYLIAKTTVAGGYRESTRESFARLAGYIFGRNRTETSLAMTAPVMQERMGQKLAMTAPVTQEQQGNNWVMSFTMPKGYTLGTLPTPLDTRVTVERRTGYTAAVYRYSGFFSVKTMAAHSVALLSWIKRNGYQPIAPTLLAGYDPPWTLPFLRRNEIQITVRRS
jgi:hypothetical protein